MPLSETLVLLRMKEKGRLAICAKFYFTAALLRRVATDQPQRNSVSRIKRKIGAGLMGCYIGFIEPGYYNVIYDELGYQQKKCCQLAWAFSGLVPGGREVLPGDG
jgi:hypothetical protein